MLNSPHPGACNDVPHLWVYTLPEVATPELASGRGGVPVTNFRGLSGGDNPLTQGAQGGKSPPENFEK